MERGREGEREGGGEGERERCKERKHLELRRVCLLGEEAIVLHNPLRENVLAQALDERGYPFARQLLVCQLRSKVVGAALRRGKSFNFLADIHQRLPSGLRVPHKGWMRRRASLQRRRAWNGWGLCLLLARNILVSPQTIFNHRIASQMCYNIIPHLGLLGHAKNPGAMSQDPPLCLKNLSRLVTPGRATDPPGASSGMQRIVLFSLMVAGATAFNAGLPAHGLTLRSASATVSMIPPP